MAQPRFNRYQSEKLTFTVLQGDITHVTADAVVTGEGCDPKKESLVTQSLIKALPHFEGKRNHLMKCNRGRLQLWNVYTTKLDPNRRFQFVLHAVLDKAKNGQWMENMKSLYKKIFTEAEKLRITSVAFTLLGTGAADTDRDLAVRAMVMSLQTYSSTYLTEVMLVNNDSRMLDKVDAYFLLEQSNPYGHSNPGLFKEVFKRVFSEVKTLLSDDDEIERNDTGYESRGGHTGGRGRGGHHTHEGQTKWYTPVVDQDKGPNMGNTAYRIGKGRGKQAAVYDEKLQIQIAMQASKEDEERRRKRIKDKENYDMQRAVHKFEMGTKSGFRHRERDFQGARYGEDDPYLHIALQLSKDDATADLLPESPSRHDSGKHSYGDEVDGSVDDSADDSSDIEVINEQEIDGKDKDASEDSQSKLSVNEAIRDQTDSIITCPICLCATQEPKQLPKCGHIFCKDCIESSFRDFKPVCPRCNMVYGVITGNQPEGNMDVGFSSQPLPGYEHHGTITITYSFPSGIQKEGHPSPGQPYKGTTRRAYLPDCREGREIMDLFRTAFKRKLTFTIGRENVITWNNFPHKTNMDGGPARFGYPDSHYLTRVRDELASKGLTRSLHKDSVNPKRGLTGNFETSQFVIDSDLICSMCGKNKANELPNCNHVICESCTDHSLRNCQYDCPLCDLQSSDLPGVSDEELVMMRSKQIILKEDIKLCVFNNTLIKEDLQTLFPEKWINDQVVNAYLSMLMRTTNDASRKQVFVLPTFLLHNWESGDFDTWIYSAVRLSDYQTVLLPVFVKKHWMLLFANVKTRCLALLNPDLTKHSRLDLYQCWIKFLVARCEAGIESLADKWNRMDLPTPQQEDRHSCGVFVLMCAHAICKGLDPMVYQQKHVDVFRQYVLGLIIHHAETRKELLCEVPHCARPEVKDRIQCDECGRWCHIACAGIRIRPAIFRCNRCN